MPLPIDINKNMDTSMLYRMPWTLTDNTSTWLEITRDCDITCEYCIQGHKRELPKPFEQVAFELKDLLRLRKCDSVVIAGGEPLTHPDIVRIVELTNQNVNKSLIITNAVALTEPLLRELKHAGLFGCILHIDSGQHRPGWQDKTEKELNELRQHYADMFEKVGGLVCSFITTILPKALHNVRDIIAWMVENNNKVVQNIIIPVRGWHPDDPWDYYVDDKKIEIVKTAYNLNDQYPFMDANDIYDEFKLILPDFEFAAFLGGTEVANAPKWVIGLYLKCGNKIIGNVGKKTVEFVEMVNHFIYGRYVSFGKKWVYSWIKPFLLPLALIDGKIRKALFTYLKVLTSQPYLLFLPVRAQVLIIMQPLDLLPNGDLDLCDGCPNRTYFEGRLVPECRMEDYLKYGKGLRHVPRKEFSADNSAFNSSEH